MFEEIIQQLPPDPSGTIITLIVVIGIAVGTLTALLGAVHSRVTMALLMLAFGAVLGASLPRWMGWDVNHSAMITIGAIAFGLAGFILHRLCVAFALAVLVCMVSLFILYDQTQPIDKLLADAVQVSSLPGTASHAWESAPPRFKALAPWIGAASFVAAGVVAMVLPKVGMAALYSLGGTLLTLFSIKLGHASDKIHWLDSIKTGPMTIVVLGIAMLVLGFATQLALLSRPATAEPETPRKEPQ